MKWIASSLSVVSMIQSGSAFPKKYQGKTGEKYPFYKVSDMNLPGNEESLIFENNTISEDTRTILKSSLLPKGSVVFPKVGAAIATNKKRILTKVSCVDNNIMGAIPKKDIIYPRYLYYWFQQHNLSEFANEAALPSIKKTTVEKWFINYPSSVPEQKRIVALLDTVFADLEQTRAKTEQNLKNARELFESYLQQVFSQKDENWIEAELFDHIKFIDYRGRTPKKTESGLRLITAKNVRMGYLKSSPEEFVAPDSYDDWMTRGIPKKGDVLFTSEAPLANVAQLDTDDKVVFAQRIITMQPDRSVINCDFLKYLLMSKPIQKRIFEKGTGATVTGIKASLLKKIIIEFPSSIEEQEQYVITLNELSNSVKKLEGIYQSKLNSIVELKKSILQKAFNGELSTPAKQVTSA